MPAQQPRRASGGTPGRASGKGDWMKGTRSGPKIQ